MSKTQLIAEPGQQNFKIIREFSAPREKVFKAFTTPELYIQWFLPPEFNMKIQKMDVKSGGSFLHSHTQAGAGLFQFYGVYHEVIESEIIYKTSEFVGLPFKTRPVLELTTFEAIDDLSTRVIIESVCASVAERDGMISAGMKPVLDITQRLLEKLLQAQP